MLAISLESLAIRHSAWLSARQKAISNNVAHASIPGYKATDVAPFADVLGKVDLNISTTNASHLRLAREPRSRFEKVRALHSVTTHSGNSVDLDKELLRANDVRQAYALNMGIVRSFNRMLLAAVKG